MQECSTESRFLVSKHAVQITEISLFPSLFQENKISGAYITVVVTATKGGWRNSSYMLYSMI